MARKEEARLGRQVVSLMMLGFTREESKSLRRISMTLQRWHERECGDGNGCIERDETTDRPVWRNSMTGRTYPIPDRETGARKRLKTIIEARNTRVCAEPIVCPNCDQWQCIDCVNGCSARGLAPTRRVSVYIQTDPRGCALYILRPGDIIGGEDVSHYYNRGLAIY